MRLLNIVCVYHVFFLEWAGLRYAGARTRLLFDTGLLLTVLPYTPRLLNETELLFGPGLYSDKYGTIVTSGSGHMFMQQLMKASYDLLICRMTILYLYSVMIVMLTLGLLISAQAQEKSFFNVLMNMVCFWLKTDILFMYMCFVCSSCVIKGLSISCILLTAIVNLWLSPWLELSYGQLHLAILAMHFHLLSLIGPKLLCWNARLHLKTSATQ